MLSDAEGLAFDSLGNLYVANQGSDTITKFDSAGHGSIFVTGVPTPRGLALHGDLYVSSIISGAIRKFNSAGTATVVASSGLFYPAGLAFDSIGNLYVANWGNGTITKFNSAGQGSTFGTAGSSYLEGLAFDIAGNLYGASYGRITKFNSSGQGTSFANPSAPKQLYLKGLAFDTAGNLYVADPDLKRIEKIDPQGQVTVFADMGSFGPVGLAFGPAAPAPILAFAPHNTFAPFENAGTDVITISRSGDISQGVNVRFSTVSPSVYALQQLGQGFINAQGYHYYFSTNDPQFQDAYRALPGVDYTALSQTVVFAPGETSQTVSVPMLNNSAYNGRREFGITLSAISAPVSIGSNATEAIIDDEASVEIVSLSNLLATVNPDGTRSFSAGLTVLNTTSTPTGPVRVRLVAHAGYNNPTPNPTPPLPADVALGTFNLGSGLDANGSGTLSVNAIIPAPQGDAYGYNYWWWVYGIVDEQISEDWYAVSAPWLVTDGVRLAAWYINPDGSVSRGLHTIDTGGVPEPGVGGNGAPPILILPPPPTPTPTPTPPAAPDLQSASDTGASSTDNITNASSLTFTITGVVNGANVELFRDSSSTPRDSGTASGTSIQLTDPSVIGDGTHSFTARQTVSGRVSPKSAPLNVVIDTTPPTISNVPANMGPEATGPGGAVVSYSSPTANEGAPVICAPASGSTFPLGPTTVTCTATDVAGNTATVTFTVTVQDSIAPAITVPADIPAEATGPGGAVVPFSAPIWEDKVDGSGTASADHNSGDTFPLGPTTVTCSHTDTHGNTGSKSFIITVQDTIAPAITVPADIIAGATAPDGAVVTFSAPAWTDTVDGSGTASANHNSGETFPLGPTTVTCSHTDAHGNTGSKSFTITVQDVLAPVLRLPSVAAVEADGPGGAVVTFAAPTANDDVEGPVPVSFDPMFASGSIFPVGPTVINCSAQDSQGHTANGSFTVNVTDTTPPEITVPGTVTVLAPKKPKGSGATANFTVCATDLVDGSVSATPDHLPNSFVFPLGATTVTVMATDSRHNASIPKTFTVSVVTKLPKVKPPKILPVVSLAPSSVSVSEGQDVTFTFTASFAPAVPMTVNYQIANLTAVAGRDYTLSGVGCTPGQLLLAAGTTQGLVKLHARVTPATSGNEALMMTLNPGSNYTVSPAANSANVTINNIP